MTLWQSIKDQPVRFFSLICVAATSAFLGYLCYRLLEVLSSPDWCSKAIQAERITPGNSFQGLTGCIDIIKSQIASLANGWYIGISTFALCLGVLVVIVLAKAKVELEAGPGGLKGKASGDRDAQAETLNAAGDALKDKAAETEGNE